LCGHVRLSNGTGWDCYRHRLYEAQASANGKATLQTTLATPSTGDLQRVIFDGGSGIGRLGTAIEFYSLDSFLGGIGGYRFGEPRLARDLATESPRSYGRHYAADRFGRTLTQSATGIELRPASAAVPAGWSPANLGTEGHLQICKDGAEESRVLDLGTGRTLITINAGTSVTHQGRQVQTFGGCSILLRTVDALGRLLGQGWIESESRNVPIIFTPAGVALP